MQWILHAAIKDENQLITLYNLLKSLKKRLLSQNHNKIRYKQNLNKLEKLLQSHRN